MATWTIARMLRWMQDDFAGRGIDNPRLDAELLLAKALGVERIRLYLELERPLAGDELDAVRALVKRRRTREPVAYILGHRDFWGRRFVVTPSVLIPRPDTETVVEQALERLAPDANGRVIDLCTGSGCVAISLACERPDLRVVATDVSSEALSVARENAGRLGAQVRFVEGDLFAGEEGPFDLVAANPPYVRQDELAALQPEVAEHEPTLALAAGPTGLEIYQRLVPAAFERLRPGGHLLLEVGAGQASPVGALLATVGFAGVTAHKDLAGHERVVAGQRPEEKLT